MSRLFIGKLSAFVVNKGVKMKLRKNVSKLLESNGEVDFMTLMQKTINAVRLNESAEDGIPDTEEGLDEFSDTEEDTGDEDLDTDTEDDDLGGEDEGREEVTITIPVDASLDEIMDAIDAARSEGVNDDLDAEADEASEGELDDLNAEADAEDAADDEFGPDEDEDFEEDEEAFAATYSEGPSRKRASGRYDNNLTIKSNTVPHPAMGKPAEYSNGAPRRVRATGTYQNNLTINSNIQKDTRIFR